MKPKVVKTADDHEAEVNKYYYNSNGEQVFLNEVLINQNGDVRFLVVPIFEGEAMDARLYPGGHTEVMTPYTHEAMPVVIDAIYKDEPVPLLGEKITEAISRLTSIAEATGDLILREKELKVTFSKMVGVEKEKSKQIDELDKQIETKNELLANKMERLVEVKQKISELEDIACHGIIPGRDITISQDELVKLRKSFFKLECLDAGGVDNWEWYDESMEKYFERYPNG